MPPTWIVLVFFYLTFHLLPLPVVLIGAVMATLGRIVLYYIAQSKFRPYLPKKSQKNLEQFAKYFNAKKHVTIPFLIAYAFSPIPSNQVYILAGISKIRLRYIATTFFCGRLISYSLWITTAHLAAKNLPALFENHYGKVVPIAIDIAGLVVIYLLTRVNWKKYLKI